MFVCVCLCVCDVAVVVVVAQFRNLWPRITNKFGEFNSGKLFGLLDTLKQLLEIAHFIREM